MEARYTVIGNGWAGRDWHRRAEDVDGAAAFAAVLDMLADGADYVTVYDAPSLTASAATLEQWARCQQMPGSESGGACSEYVRLRWLDDERAALGCINRDQAEDAEAVATWAAASVGLPVW